MIIIIAIIIIIIVVIIYSFRVLLIDVSWWSLTGVWVTASLLKSPGLFSIFWPFSIMLSFGCSPLVLQLPSPPSPLIIIYVVTVPKSNNHNWYNYHLHAPCFFNSLARFWYFIIIITIIIRKLLGIRLHSINLIKEINTWAISS